MPLAISLLHFLITPIFKRKQKKNKYKARQACNNREREGISPFGSPWTLVYAIELKSQDESKTPRIKRVGPGLAVGWTLYKEK